MDSNGRFQSQQHLLRLRWALSLSVKSAAAATVSAKHKIVAQQLERMGYVIAYESVTKLIGIQSIQENNLKIQAEVIGADGDGKSLLVYYPVISGLEDTAVQLMREKLALEISNGQWRPYLEKNEL